MALVLETFIFRPEYFSNVLRLSNSSFAEAISDNSAVMSSAWASNLISLSPIVMPFMLVFDLMKIAKVSMTVTVP